MCTPPANVPESGRDEAQPFAFCSRFLNVPTWKPALFAVSGLTLELSVVLTSLVFCLSCKLLGGLASETELVLWSRLPELSARTQQRILQWPSKGKGSQRLSFRAYSKPGHGISQLTSLGKAAALFEQWDGVGRETDACQQLILAHHLHQPATHPETSSCCCHDPPPKKSSSSWRCNSRAGGEGRGHSNPAPDYSPSIMLLQNRQGRRSLEQKRKRLHPTQGLSGMRVMTSRMLCHGFAFRGWINWHWSRHNSLSLIRSYFAPPSFNLYMYSRVRLANSKEPQACLFPPAFHTVL